MAQRGTLNHLKTRRLAERLDIDLSHALGLIEALLQVAMEQNPPDGGVGRMTNRDLVFQMRSSIEPDKVIKAMLYAGQLERDENCRLYIHHFHEHCFDYIDNWLARHTLRYANGSMPRMDRLQEKERDKLLARYSKAPKTAKSAKVAK